MSDTAFLSANRPVAEFIDWLRDWAIRQRAEPRVIDKLDDLRDLEGREAEIEKFDEELERLGEELEQCQTARNDAITELDVLLTVVRDYCADYRPDEHTALRGAVADAEAALAHLQT